MKKLIFLLTAVISVSVYAQKSQVGITAGTAIANYKAKLGSISFSTKSNTGFTAGVFANIAAGNSLVFQPALNWVQKGSKVDESANGYVEKSSLITSHIEMAANTLFSSNGFFAGGGPTLSFGISGTSKAESGGTKTSEKVKFGNSDDDDMKSFDLGANLLAGYQFKKGFLIAANYNIGLSNLAPGSDPDKGKLKSSYFGIKLGYVLNNAGSK
ncbi:outer membrane beta-barrel protein [Ferruginibacter sp.]|nr:PorT family protein [Ferruginibacter sp.]